jgi:hypothetical protein
MIVDGCGCVVLSLWVAVGVWFYPCGWLWVCGSIPVGGCGCVVLSLWVAVGVWVMSVGGCGCVGDVCGSKPGSIEKSLLWVNQWKI